jgi:hypothetical protein
MRPYQLDIDPADVDADGLAVGNSSAGATLTLDGALTSGGTFTSADGLGHRLVILDTGADDQTGATYTITGTDSNGAAQTESIAGPSISSSVTTVKYFLTVTSVAIASPAAGSTVDMGTVDEVASKIVPLNYRHTEPATYQIGSLAGTVNFSVEETLSEIHQLSEPSDAIWVDVAALSAKTADILDNGIVHSTAGRLVFNSYTSGAELQFTTFQNESI